MGELFDNLWMQPVHETRRENLKLAIRDHFPSARQLALRIGVHPNSISRVFSDSSRDRRNVGDDMARAIEREAGLPEGWMDTQHDDAEGVGESEGDYTTTLTGFMSTISQMPDDQLEEFITGLAEHVSPQSAMKIARLFFERAEDGL